LGHLSVSIRHIEKSADGYRRRHPLQVGPKVLEFNCRLGDPETQAILARVDFDLAQALINLATKRFDPAEWKWKSGASTCLVIASVVIREGSRQDSLFRHNRC